MQSICPCLWFDNNAEEAANFYLSVFKDGEILSKTHYGEGAPAPAGSVMTVSFRINGAEFTALNGGPYFTFSPAVSFIINCRDQVETDYYWEKLCAGGKAEQCGWLKDRFGVSWQVVPTQLMELLQTGEPDKLGKMMSALMRMQRLDIQALLHAYHG